MPYGLEQLIYMMKKIEYLRSILADERLLLGVIKDEIIAIKEKYADDRRNEIRHAEGSAETGKVQDLGRKTSRLSKVESLLGNEVLKNIFKKLLRYSWLR